MGLSLKHRLFQASARGVERLLRGVSQDAFLKIASDLQATWDLTYQVDTGHGGDRGEIRIWADSQTARIRAREMMYREPDTLRWIEGFSADDVLLDVGSNIGVFSLYAAVVAKCRVVAFDPLPFNYVGLVRNIALNGLDDRINPFCVAVTDRTRVAPLYMSAEATMTGGANCPFAEPIDNAGGAVEASMQLPMLGYAIDDFLQTFDVPFPTHIKVDIDGSHDKVIAGARRTLRDPRVKSAMCEILPGREMFDFFVREMAEAGFRHVRTVRATPNLTEDIELHNTNNFFERV